MPAFLQWATIAVLAPASPQVALEGPPARSVTLVAPPGTDIRADIEWRAIEGAGTSLQTRQAASLRGRTVLAVAHREGVLRVRPAGKAPLSFFLPAGTSDLTLELPAPEPGGEVWGTLPPHRFRPEALEIEGGGHRRRLRPDARGFFQAAGLAPGVQAVVPRYRGGIAGRAVRVVVRAGETAEALPLPLPETGGARVSLAEALCGESDLSLELRRETASGAPGAYAFRRDLPSSACEVEVQGLEEGAWSAIATGGGFRNEPRAAVDFEVAKGQSAAVVLEPVVRVRGRVTLAGQPAPRLRLAFERGTRAWSTETDGDGAYAAVLAEPGEYAVTARASRDLPSRSFLRPLRGGDQQEDLELGEAALEVRVRGEASAAIGEPVRLALLARDGRRVAGVFHPREEERARFVGLEYGEYSVTASTASGLVSRELVPIELSPAAPVAEVEVVLGRQRGLMRLTQADGAPIAGARAVVGAVALAEQAPGVFPLDQVAAGERLLVNAPGYLPVCRTLRPQDLPELRLTPPSADGTLTLHLPPDLSWQAGALGGLPGSDCPVALDEVAPRIRADPQGITMVLQLPRGSFALSLGHLTQPVVVPGPEVVIVP